MFPTMTVVGRIGKNITAENLGGFRPNYPLLVTLIVSKWVTGRDGQNGHQESDTWLVKLWPQTETDYNNLCYRLHIGALAQFMGEFRTGSYLDPKTQVWANNPYIHTINFQILSKAPWRLKEEADAKEAFNRQHEAQNFPNANTAQEGSNVVEKVKAGNATRKKQAAVVPNSTDLPKPTNAPYENDLDLDSDLPF